MTTKVHKYASGKVFKQENANPVCRKSFTNRFGDKIALMGRHGFEWTVVVSKMCGTTQSTVFPEGRAAALKYYNKLCKEYSDHKRRTH